MTRRILVPVDGSRKSTEGLEHALSTYGDASITLLHVVNTHRMTEGVDAGDGDAESEGGDDRAADLSREFSEEWFERAREEADAVLAEAEAVADGYGVTVSTAVEVGEPWRAIVEYAETNDVDHIVMGSHGRTEDSPVPLGSVAQAVMRRSPVLVSIVR